jgi:hypothetical protein
MCQKHTSALWPQCTHFHTPVTFFSSNVQRKASVSTMWINTQYLNKNTTYILTSVSSKLAFKFILLLDNGMTQCWRRPLNWTVSIITVFCIKITHFRNVYYLMSSHRKFMYEGLYRSQKSRNFFATSPSKYKNITCFQGFYFSTNNCDSGERNLQQHYVNL